MTRPDPGSPPGVSPARWAAILADLRRRGTDAGEVTVMSSRSVIWPDGSLGCPQPGLFYTQAVVPGARVVVATAGATFDYRFGRDDTPVLCTSPPATLPEGAVTDH